MYERAVASDLESIRYLFAFVAVDSRPALLRKFLDYYRSLGVDQLSIVLHRHSDERTSWITAKDIVIRRGGSVLRHLQGAFSDVEKVRILNELKRDLGDQWCFVADVDEFVSISKDEMQRVLRSTGDYVTGRLVDRVALGGELPEIGEESDLEKLFPLRSDFTAEVLGGYPWKVPVSRGRVPLVIGHHDVEESARSWARPVSGLVLNIDHYKWCADVIARIERRLRSTENERRHDWERHWRLEMLRFLQHVRTSPDDRLQVEQFKVW